MSVTAAGRGKWKVVINLGHVAGKRARRAYYVEGTRKDADKFERERLRERDTDRLPTDGSATLAQVAADFMEIRASNFSPTTAARYKSLLDCHILPHLGRIRVEAIRARDVEALYAELCRSGHRRRKGGLSGQTLIHVHALLRAVFTYAKKNRFVADSAMASVDRPVAVKRRRQVIPADKLAAFAEALRRSKYRTPILLAVATGLRRGEVLGLRWQDVDLEHGSLSVAQTLVETEAGDLHIKKPKSQTSTRTIALSASTVALLREHKAAQAEIALMLGRDYKRSLDLVCTTADGDYMRPARLTTGYRGLAALHGLSGVGLHDLRHTHATWLLEAGVALKTISDRLGHSTIALTANTYAHVTEKLDREAADKFDAYLKTS